MLADDLTVARRVEATRRDFVANVSHELKTPIGAISLLAEAVEEAADDPAAVRRFAGRMGIESARLADLVSQIIDLSRLQAEDPMGAAETRRGRRRADRGGRSLPGGRRTARGEHHHRGGERAAGDG